jgi:hypothetical protein
LVGLGKLRLHLRYNAVAEERYHRKQNRGRETGQQPACSDLFDAGALTPFLWRRLSRLRKRLTALRERRLMYAETVANEWGRLNARRPLPVIDGLLAATAKIHRMTLVTRNMAEVAALDVRILNPFERR